MAEDAILAYLASQTNPNDNEQTTLNLIQMQIRKLPSKLFELSCLRQLSLDYNRIASIPKEFCIFLNNLESLFLNGNNLTTLPDNIGFLKQLKKLEINENHISKLPETFQDLYGLETLCAVGNDMKKLPHNFGNLVNLKQLTVDENQLNELPCSFGNLTKLQQLDSSCNKLKTLPENFGSLESLQFLDLSNNRLTLLPESFQTLVRLKVVDISDNLIAFLPTEISCTGTLAKLFADNNNISEIPDWFSELELLEELSLQSNHLRNSPFPESFGELVPRLKVFNLSGNYLSALPSSFDQLRSLETMDMGSVLPEVERRRNLFNGNFLVRLPLNFGFITTLKEVRLDENLLEELPESFGNLVNLEFLDLNHNKLSVLPDSFCQLRSLSVCMLSINNLIKLPEEFGNLTNLIDLRLDNNMLKELPESLSLLTKLHTLDLYCNAMETLPPVLKKLKTLKRLDLNENNFGIPVLEVPEISFKAHYSARDPDLENNWRGRKRADILDVQQYFRPQNGEENELSQLQEALEQGLSLWKKHGRENLERSPAINGEVSNQSDVHQESESDTTSGEEDAEDYYSVPAAVTPEEEQESQEFWNPEPLNDPFGYFEDSVIDSIPVLPVPAGQSFIPSADHPLPFKMPVLYFPACIGQFDDVES